MPESAPEIDQLTEEPQEMGRIREAWEKLRDAHWIGKVSVCAALAVGGGWILIDHAADKAAEKSQPMLDGATDDVKIAFKEIVDGASCDMKQQFHDEIATAKVELRDQTSEAIKRGTKKLEKGLNKKVDEGYARLYAAIGINPDDLPEVTTSTTSTTVAQNATTSTTIPLREKSVATPEKPIC